MQNQDDNTKMQRGITDINQAFKERDVQAKAKAQGIPYMNLIKVPINSDLAKVFSQEDAERTKAALFFKSGKNLRFAALDPNGKEAQELTAKFKAEGYDVKFSLCSEESLKAAHRIYFRQNYKKKAEVKTEFKEESLGSFREEVTNLGQLKDTIEHADFDVALQHVQMGAYKTHATDIHFQPQENDVLVRLRIDGVLLPVFSLSRRIYEGILKEVKRLTHLKLNVSNIPQEGQYVFPVNDNRVNVRVAILPALHGETCVMRLLDSKRTFTSFNELGYEGDALKNIVAAAQLPHGLILMTGPTGSGKTTTMYSLLKSIDVSAKKVITLEDPVEYDLNGIIQSQVDHESGYTFANGLKAILRQDPDVIMVGEIRDLETAEMAAQASLTGHLVISTLHTNSAIESIPRLVNMGVKNFILAPSLNLIVAQRLVRRICPDCVQEKAISVSEKEHIEFALQKIQGKGLPVPAVPATLKKAAGCDKCSHTGFRGQLAIAEVLSFNQELRDLILAEKPMPEIYDYIDKHLKMLTLHEDGVLKAVKGLTTLDEVYRVAA